MDVEDMKKKLFEIDSLEFYHHYLVGNEFWYYKSRLNLPDYSVKYDTMRRYIAGKLGIHFNNISVFGSAKIGFSMNPEKNFKDFNDDSDIDIVLVSEELFIHLWEAYLDMHSGLRYIKNYESITSSLFRQFISLDGFDSKSPRYIEWTKRTAGFKKDLQLSHGFSNHKINYRIFKSWDAVQRYYVRNIDDLKRKKSREGGRGNDQ